MGFLDRVTGGSVAWTLAFDGATNVVPPGSAVRGTARLTPAESLDSRGITASLVATEEFAYEVTEDAGSQHSRVDRRWQSAELWRQDLPLMPPSQLAAGATQELAFMFQLPADAPPTVDTAVLRVRWLLSVSIDRGGIDASTVQDIIVPLSATSGGAALGPGATERFDGVEDERTFAILVQPSVLVSGAPFQGLVEVAEPLDLKSTRVELKVKASTNWSAGLGLGIELGGGVKIESQAKRAVHEERSVWQGTLSEIEPADGRRRYLLQGQVPPERIATVTLPHGEVTATLDVIINRRMRRDEHFRRPVAIASAP